MSVEIAVVASKTMLLWQSPGGGGLPSVRKVDPCGEEGEVAGGLDARAQGCGLDGEAQGQGALGTRLGQEPVRIPVHGLDEQLLEAAAGARSSGLSVARLLEAHESALPDEAAAKLVRQRMRVRDLSEGELARRLGITDGALSRRLNKGADMHLASITAIVWELRVDLHQCFEQRAEQDAADPELDAPPMQPGERS